MTVLALAARAAIAVLLLAAGGAKLADPASFRAAVRLFVPARVVARSRPVIPVTAAAIIGCELAAGAISLCWPAARWAGLAVLALACGFMIVAGLGYARHRGRPCRCFGALTQRGFTVRSLVQSALILVAAVLASYPAGPAEVRLGLAGHLLLLAAASLMALAARTAARALADPAQSRTPITGVPA